MIHINITHPPMFRASYWSVFFWPSHQYPIYVFLFSPHLCYVPCQSHLSWLYNSNYTWRRVQVIQLIWSTVNITYIVKKLLTFTEGSLKC
jgi:hypothetical protein